MISNLRSLCGIISWEFSEPLGLPYTNQGGQSIPTTNVSYIIGVSCLMDIAWGIQKLGLIFEPLLKENNTKLNQIIVTVGQIQQR